MRSASNIRLLRRAVFAGKTQSFWQKATKSSISHEALRKQQQQHNVLVAVFSVLIIPSMYNSQYYDIQVASNIANCQQSQQQHDSVVMTRQHHLMEMKWSDMNIKQKTKRVWRLIKRIVQLTFTLGPVLLLYPILWLDNTTNNDNDNNENKDAFQTVISFHEDNGIYGQQDNISKIRSWYYWLCLEAAECSGAAVIKLMQWAGSRPDLFGYEFCNIFCKLQDDTKPHRWKHTERLLRETYGNDWKDHIELYEILGSGCIGQVYRGIVKDTNQKVAVKVLHPNVRDDIDADLDLMRLAVRCIKYVPFGIFDNLRWLNMEGVVEEFASLLKLQIDLRREAANLIRFNENFSNNNNVEFPKLVDGFIPSKDILVETFCEGIPVTQFCKENRHQQPLLTNLCRDAIKAVCQMIFLDNFVHGDLHPGNIFVSPDGKKFVLFDVGIVNEYQDADHNLIVDVLAAFIRKKGRLAGRLMIDDSNMKLSECGDKERAVNEDEYITKIEALTIKARTKGYLMEHLGTYISYICDAAATHHIRMNESFISAALAVKIQEGVALALDPDVSIPKIAIPIIVESERRRYSQNAADILSFENVKKAIFGDNNENNTGSNNDVSTTK